MHGTCLAIVATTLLVVSVGRAELSAQGGGGRGPLQRFEVDALKALADGVAAGNPGGGDAWLAWDGHFMRAPDGRVYVPFTLMLDDVMAGFESIGIYVRVTPRGAESPSGNPRVSGTAHGVGISVPERQFSRGSPTAGEASARLALMTSELSAVKHPFEGFFTAQTTTGRTSRGASGRLVRRAFLVAPGDYDLYVAVRERPRPGGSARPKSAVMRRPLSVPNFTGAELTMSSIILAERIDPLAMRLSAVEQADRPYALGSAEIVPASGASFQSDGVLSAVFFVYNVAVDKTNLPDVTVEYRVQQVSAPGKTFGETVPQRFSANHEPPVFDGRAGRQLAIGQTLPFTALPPDTYDVEIVVTDNLAGRSVRQAARFTVEGR